MFTPFPPLPLEATGTSDVESLESYISRLADTLNMSTSMVVGILAKHCSRKIPMTTAASTGTAGTYHGPSSSADARVLALEELTGVRNLRRGTFWALSLVLCQNYRGQGLSRRRWCPRCYAHTDVNSHEPLAWAIAMISRCPRDHVSLVCECPHCGATQHYGQSWERRRYCQRCAGFLGGAGSIGKLSTREMWIEDATLNVVAFMAEEDREQVPYQNYLAFLDGLRKKAEEDGATPDYVRVVLGQALKRKAPGRPSLGILLNLMALQGITIEAMLLRPREAASRPLIDTWSGFRPVSRTPLIGDVRYSFAVRVIDLILEQTPASGYLLPIEWIARKYRASVPTLAEKFPELVGRYCRRIEAQGRLCSPAVLESLLETSVHVVESRALTSTRGHGARYATELVSATLRVNTEVVRPIVDAVIRLENAVATFDTSGARRLRALGPLSDDIDGQQDDLDQ